MSPAGISPVLTTQLLFDLPFPQSSDLFSSLSSSLFPSTPPPPFVQTRILLFSLFFSFNRLCNPQAPSNPFLHLAACARLFFFRAVPVLFYFYRYTNNTLALLHTGRPSHSFLTLSTHPWLALLRLRTSYPALLRKKKDACQSVHSLSLRVSPKSRDKTSVRATAAFTFFHLTRLQLSIFLRIASAPPPCLEKKRLECRATSLAPTALLSCPPSTPRLTSPRPQRLLCTPSSMLCEYCHCEKENCRETRAHEAMMDLVLLMRRAAHGLASVLPLSCLTSGSWTPSTSVCALAL